MAPEDVLSQACRVRVNYRPIRRNDREDGRDDENDDDAGIRTWVAIGLTKASIIYYYTDLHDANSMCRVQSY